MCNVLTACLAPPSLSNGVYLPQQTVYVPGNKIAYSCNRNYDISGGNTNHCLFDGRWFVPNINNITKCLQSEICSNKVSGLHLIKV